MYYHCNLLEIITSSCCTRPTLNIFRGAMGDEGGEQGPEEGDEYPCSGRDVPGGPGYQGPSPH